MIREPIATRQPPVSQHMTDAQLDRRMPLPLYYQVKTVVLQRIRAGEFKPNDQLPAEDVLARQFGVSKATVRHALNELTREGVLRRVQGSGTFVADPRIELGAKQLLSFTAEMRARGLEPSSRVLHQEVQVADARLTDLLGLPAEAGVLCLRRLRLTRGEPMILQTTYLPLHLAPGIEHRDFSNNSLYEVLSDSYGVVPARAHETHRAVLLAPHEAEVLNSEPGTAALKVQRITFDATGRPFEVVDSLMRGDRYEIVIDVASEAAKYVKQEF